jgi:glycosyltransferase involved in cell wall biosynthesis
MPGIDIEVFAFDPGSPSAYGRAAKELHRRYRGELFDVVHAHFGLTAWPALAAPARARAVTLHGTDLAHPRSRVITLAALPLLQLVAAVSEPLAEAVPRWATRGDVAVLPCGVDLSRFRAIDRSTARAALGLQEDGPYLLFPADPRRPEKRHDLAVAVAGETPLLSLVGVDPKDVPLWINAANAVVAPSDREGFGLSVLEALACDVPVLSTPVGVAPEVLAGLTGAFCGSFELDTWRAALTPHLEASDPRIDGRARAEGFSSDRTATTVLSAWRRLVTDRATTQRAD